jgi:hypothetical protein
LTPPPGALQTPEVNTNPEIEELQRGIRRFVRNAGGVTNIAAGGLILAAYFLATLIDVLGAWTRIALAATPFAWVAVKELLRRRFARRHPVGEERRGELQRQWHRLFIAMSALVGVMVIVVAVVSRSDASFPAGRALPLTGYVLFGVMTPIAVWRYVRTTEEILVGLFLIAQAALFLVSTNVELGAGVQMPIAAAVAVLLGVKQQLEYRQLIAEIERQRAVADIGGT